jgi:CheY-like chemotaxis protein
LQTHSLAATRGFFPQACLPAPALDFARESLRILIVNEDMRSADALKSTLHELGHFTTLTAYSARRALAAAADFSPSVALVDLELPDMTGYQLARKLRAHLRDHVRAVPLLAISERQGFGHIELARAAGFIGCLSKPVLPLELNCILRRLQR